MKILVTGTSGFIGKHLVPFLLAHGIEVICTSRNDKKIKSSSWYEQVSFIPFDLDYQEEEIDYYAFFNKPDVLIHLAWSGLPNYRSMTQIEDNLMKNYFFIKNLVQNGLENVNVLGTCLEYGDYSGELSEDLIVQPNLPYSIAKNSLRTFLAELNKDFQFYFKWIRIFYVYGEGQNPKSLYSQLLSSIDLKKDVFNMSKGEQLRDFIPIDDAIYQIFKISTQTEIEGIINCCSGTPKSVRALVEEVLEHKKSRMELNLGFYPYPSYEPMAFWGAQKKINKILKKS